MEPTESNILSGGKPGKMVPIMSLLCHFSWLNLCMVLVFAI